MLGFLSLNFVSLQLFDNTFSTLWFHVRLIWTLTK